MNDEQKKIAIGAAVGGIVGGIISVVARGGMSSPSGATRVTLSPGWLHGSTTMWKLSEREARKMINESGIAAFYRKLPAVGRIRVLPDGREIAHYPDGYYLIKGEP